MQKKNEASSNHSRTTPLCMSSLRIYIHPHCNKCQHRHRAANHVTTSHPLACTQSFFHIYIGRCSDKRKRTARCRESMHSMRVARRRIRDIMCIHRVWRHEIKHADSLWPIFATFTNPSATTMYIPTLQTIVFISFTQTFAHPMCPTPNPQPILFFAYYEPG